MEQSPLQRHWIEGKNSVLYGNDGNFLFYEKLANTIHSGNIEQLRTLQEKAESVEYHPRFESDSLMKGRNDGFDALLLNVTESCNLACEYCIYSGQYENERTETTSSMGVDIAKKALDRFLPQSTDFPYIGFYGGEPLNNMPFIKAVVDYARTSSPDKDLVFSMTTNFCDGDKYLNYIVDNGIYANISLDGPKEVHDKFRRYKNGKPTHSKIMRNLEKVEEYAPGYMASHFSQNVTIHNINDLPMIIDFFQKNEGFTVSRISRTETKGLNNNGNSNQEFSNVQHILDYLEAIVSEEDPGVLKVLFDQDLKHIAARSQKVMPETLMLNGSCYPGRRKLFVDTDGTFYMCEKFGRRVPIGNTEEGINEDLIEDAIKRFTDIRNNLCSDCWAGRLCNACIQSAKDSARDISEKGLSQTCKTRKSQLLMGINNYVFISKRNHNGLKKYVQSIKFK